MGRKHTCRVRIANTTVTKIWCQKQMVSVFWVAESVQHPGPATVGWIPFSCPCPIVTGRWMRLFLIDGLYPAVKAWQMHHPVIIELFGVMCQDSPKDGSHLFSQINSKHHGQAFRHLGKGRRFFVGSARVSKTVQPNHGQDGQHVFARRRRASPEAIAQEPAQVSGACNTQTQGNLLGHESLGLLQHMKLAQAHTVQRQRPAKREGHSAQNHSHFRSFRVTGYHDIPGERQVLYAAPLLW